MSVQLHRLPSGGLVDRERPLAFRFDGRLYEGYAGDTLASALLANGVRLVGRSFKYHRPRGVYTAGPEEPNALVRLRGGARAEPNTRATMVELFDGLEAESQNRWPSLRFDLGAVNSLLSPFFPAGFYYKTFMWPAGRWESYEKEIRRAAGLGIGPREPDPDHYGRRHAHCDVLVIGGGPAGLAAALAAAREGARVILADERAELGGALRRERMSISGEPALDWVARTIGELADMPEVVLLQRTTGFGYYDHNLVALVERVADHRPAPLPFEPRQRLWLVRAKQVVLATGAIERPLVFGDNDRPGVMLASAARAYVNQFAVQPGRRAVIFANNDDAYRTAADLAAAGIEIAAIVDPRADAPAAAMARKAGYEVLAGHAVVRARGGRTVEGVEIMRCEDGALAGAPRHVECDLVCVSGGWTPSLHLHSQSGGKIVYDDALAAFVPGVGKQASRSAGAALGHLDLAACLRDGLAAGAAAAAATGHGSGAAPDAPGGIEESAALPEPLWAVPLPRGRHRKRFVDIQDDVTADDVALAAREGFVSVEHLKRYTTLGMGTDQGKTSNVNGLAIMAELRGETIPQVGTTTFRPPYTPVTLGALVGAETGKHLDPIRRSPMHGWHEAAGAVFVPAGLWLRPRYYPLAGEGMAEAAAREVRQVRGGVGLVDVSPLGKIDVQGPDAAEFLERVYVNHWKSLPIGRARYGIMLREDGLVFDDGTTSRIGENRFFMTTTTANAAKVMQHLEYHLQVVWPELRVHVTSVSEQWAGMALAGPRSREVLARLADGLDVGDAALPYLGVAEGRLAGVPARVFRISFSGELAYEINVPAGYGTAMWEALMAAGKPSGIVPYGTEAMAVMRIEKGHVAGPELDGRTTPDDLGLGRMVSRKKDFIGRRMLSRPALTDPDRLQLVGLVPVDRKTALRGGAHLVADPRKPPPVDSLGVVTSVCRSPTLGHPIALALLARGRQRHGEVLHAVSPLTGLETAVEVTSPLFHDPEGKRLHG